MHPETDSLEQADEEILGFTVTDEALEAAAGVERWGRPTLSQCRHWGAPAIVAVTTRKLANSATGARNDLIGHSLDFERRGVAAVLVRKPARGEWAPKWAAVS